MLSKRQGEMFGSKLTRWNLLPKEIQVCVFRDRHSKFKSFFSLEDGLVFCNNLSSQMDALLQEYKWEEWHLLIDLSKVSLKSVLLPNRNNFPSISIVHAVNMKAHKRVCNCCWKISSMRNTSGMSVANWKSLFYCSYYSTTVLFSFASGTAESE